MRLILTQPRIKLDLTQSHFIAGSEARIETRVQLSQKCSIVSISHFEAPQALSDKLSPVKQVTLGENAPWDQAVSTIIPTRLERQVEPGKPGIGVLRI